MNGWDLVYQDCPSKFTICTKWGPIPNTFSLGMRRGQELVDQFSNGPFRHLLKIKRKWSANQALHKLVVQELRDSCFSMFNRWFHIGGRDIWFSAIEYALVTGLTFGASKFDPNSHDVVPQSSLLHTYYKGNKTKAKKPERDFENNRICIGSLAQCSRAANLLM